MNFASVSRRTGGISWINIILGLWLIISPWALGFTANHTAMWNTIVVGIAIGLFALIRFGDPHHPAWSWLDAVLGVWLVISAFGFGFPDGSSPMWNSVMVGALVTIIAVANAIGSPMRAEI